MISTALNQDTNPVKAYIFYPAKADGTPETTGAPYPLVIYSPGQGSSAMDYTYLLGKVASYGFMVLSLDRTNDPNDPTQPTQDYAPGVVSRTLDLKLLIDLGDRLTAPAGSLAGLIDMEKIAIAGYSWGGLDALVGGGARWSFGYCAVHLAEAGVVNFCIHVQPDLQEIANGLGLGSVPTGMWPTMNDPRVDAVIAMAPVGDMWGAAFEGVAAMKVPALIMTGTKDTNIDPQLFTLPLYRHLGSQKKSLVQFEGEDHFVFLGTDTDADLVSHFVVAFLLVELKGDAVAAKALAPASVTFQGVKYETTEFKTGQ